MVKMLAAIAVCLVVGFAAARWIAGPDEPELRDDAAASPVPATSFDAGAPVEARIRALEQAVSDERYARQVLEEEIWYLSGELLHLSGETLPGADIAEAAPPADDSRSSRREQYRRRNSIEGRMDALVEAGFLPSQATTILRRESELQMASLQARYEAERSGDPGEYYRNRTASSDALRQELGEADYERYLTATGRSTSITVSSVIDSSPAQSAGLLPGDEIIRYDGARVFSMTDLTHQTMDGVAGENIVVDVMRDGNLIQVVLPRGPVGISGGRRRR